MTQVISVETCSIWNNSSAVLPQSLQWLPARFPVLAL